MPATRHALTDTPPAHLYLDTSVILSYLVSTDVHHQLAADFMVHLATYNSTTLYVSALSWMEFAYVVTSQRWRDDLPPDWQSRYQLHQWQHAAIRRSYLTSMLGLLETLLTAYPWLEIPLTLDTRQRALQHVMDYNLDTHDAVHWASAQGVGVLDLASFDQGFLRVDGLHLWTA